MDAQTEPTLTPLMKQFNDLKAQVPDALLLFRMGDFYELFGDDAVEAAKILEITLTSRDKGKANPMPMAGVPHHSIQGYLQRLLKAGKKIAIGEQVEDPATVKGKAIVRREIVRVLSPAIQFDHEGSDAAFLAIVTPADRALPVTPQNKWIIACLDPSTGEARIGEPGSTQDTALELSSLPIKHFLKTTSTPLEFTDAVSRPGVLLEEISVNSLHSESAEKLLSAQYALNSLETFVPLAEARWALGLLIQSVLKAQKQERLLHLQIPQPLHAPSTLVLGPRTSQHLDLVSDGSLQSEPKLFDRINATRSASGARELKRWLIAPLSDSAMIGERQQAVRTLGDDRRARESLAANLKEIYDMERIAGRVNAGVASPRDTLALGKSLNVIPLVLEVLKAHQAKSTWISNAVNELVGNAETLAHLAKTIVSQQKDDAPLTTRDGGIFNKGVSADLDRLIELSENGERWLIDLEARERAATGISSLKVRYNRVFGYYIEITQAHLASAPAHYQRKQTTVGAERFFTEELKKFEEEILTAEVRRKSMEQSMFQDLVKTARDNLSSIMHASHTLARVDAIAAITELLHQPGWTLPVVQPCAPQGTCGDLVIKAGRHPLVDESMHGKFVPNDLILTSDRRCAIITGPNMGGKSTVMRQVALIVILGQIGAPVPAQSAEWNAFQSIYTRIGAHDAIARGQSTFMVEMSELAHILHFANERSLLILDEIGRGTSTYDGMSVAWAALDWIARRLGSRTLFATHYHELTHLEGQLPGVINAHMAAETGKQGLRFLYQLQAGPTAESFGIHVAELAGLPRGVIKSAWKVLERLEEAQANPGLQASTNSLNRDQLSLFSAVSAESQPESSEATADPRAEAVKTEIESLDLNEMTPVQALNFLVKVKDSLKLKEL